MGTIVELLLIIVMGALTEARGQSPAHSTLRMPTKSFAGTDSGPWIPNGFSNIEPVIRARHNGARRAVHSDIFSCDNVPKPGLGTQIPTWADRTVEKLRARGFKELVDHSTGRPTQAFENGPEIVLKKCTRTALEQVEQAVKPLSKKNPADPIKHIYFSCGDADTMFTINLHQTFDLGRQGTGSMGTYRLIAPDRNVILDGGGRVRIMRVLRRATVLIYGVTFTRGETGNNYKLTFKGMPEVGYGGAGILVGMESALTAYKCTFQNNKVKSSYARWGGGAAIKLEKGAYGHVYECHFEDNDAAVGGAIATSSSVVLQIVNSKFLRNVARGGMDDNGNRPEDKYTNPKKERRVILVRGGAVRIDSVIGSDDILGQHVLICGSEFTENKIRFKAEDLVKKFRYKADDWFYVRGAGAAAALWNAPFNMDEIEDNHNFAAVKYCVFKDNYESMPKGPYMGRFVFESMGAGHFKIEASQFIGNRVKDAVLRVDHSERWINGTMPYKSIFRKLRFVDNRGPVYNLGIPPERFDSWCLFKNVDGVPSRTGECSKILKAAVERGGNGVAGPDI